MKVKYLKVSDGKKLNIGQFPNFSYTGINTHIFTYIYVPHVSQLAE